VVLNEINTFQDQDKIRRSLEAANDVYHEYDYLSAISSRRVAPAQTGRLAQAKAIFETDFGNDEEDNSFLEQVLLDSGLPNFLPKEGLVASQFYNPTDYQVLDIAQRAAALSDIPTSSSNYRKPRTVGAGWDPDTNVLTVVFRDGTFWNYYDVAPSEWAKFHFAFSKGPLLVGKDEAAVRGIAMGSIAAHTNGPADVSMLGEYAREQLYRIARTAQILNREGFRRTKNVTTGEKYRTRGTPGAQGGGNRAARATRASRTALGSSANPAKNLGKNTTKK